MRLIIYIRLILSNVALALLNGCSNDDSQAVESYGVLLQLDVAMVAQEIVQSCLPIPLELKRKGG